MGKLKYLILILLIGLIVISLALTFLNLNQNNSNNFNDNSTKTFSKDNIAFDYPGSWQDYTEKFNANNSEKQLAFVGDPNTVGFHNMTLPTTALVITKTEDVSNTGNFTHPEGFMPESLIESFVNNTKKS